MAVTDPVCVIKMLPDLNRRWWQVWKPLYCMQPHVIVKHLSPILDFDAPKAGVYQLKFYPDEKFEVVRL